MSNKVISITLALCIVLAAVAIVCLSVVGQPYDKFTEFYLLGPGGQAGDYPREVVAGEEAGVIVGIVNREQEGVTYRVAMKVADGAETDIATVSLGYQDKWEQPVRFSFPEAGQDREAQFLLYRDGLEGVYDQLRLVVWVRDINEKYTEFYVLKYPPHVLQADAPTKAIAEIINHQRDAMSYRLEVQVGTVIYQAIEPITLQDGEKQQLDVPFAARVRGIYRVYFILREYETNEVIRQADCEIEVR